MVQPLSVDGSIGRASASGGAQLDGKTAILCVEAHSLPGSLSPQGARAFARHAVAVLLCRRPLHTSVPKTRNAPNTIAPHANGSKLHANQRFA